MSELDRERREMAAVLQQPGIGPDPKMQITRRTFIHRSCLTGAATVAQTFAWWPLINTIDIAYAAEAAFQVRLDFRHPSLSGICQHALRREGQTRRE